MTGPLTSRLVHLLADARLLLSGPALPSPALLSPMPVRRQYTVTMAPSTCRAHGEPFAAARATVWAFSPASAVRAAHHRLRRDGHPTGHSPATAVIDVATGVACDPTATTLHLPTG